MKKLTILKFITKKYLLIFIILNFVKIQTSLLLTKKNFYIDKIFRNLILSIFSKIKYKQFFLIFWFIKEKTFFFHLIFQKKQFII